MDKARSERWLRAAELMIGEARANIERRSNEEILEAGADLFIRVCEGTLIIHSNGEVSCVPDVAAGEVVSYLKAQQVAANRPQ